MVGGTAKEELGREPPVLDVDGLGGLLEGYGDGPEVVATIDVPLDQVALPLGKVRFEAIGLADLGPLFVAALLVFLIMAMIGVELFGMSVSLKEVQLEGDENHIMWELTKFPSLPIWFLEVAYKRDDSCDNILVRRE